MKGSSSLFGSFSGKILVLVAIFLMALNLRSAVAAASPVFVYIAQDMQLSVSDMAIIGMLPPVLFAICGALTPSIVRRASLESVTVLALAIQAFGLIVRTVSPSSVWLIVGSILIFAGIGMGNVLLPPLVKKNFSQNIALMTTAYTTLIAVGTFAPAFLAVPIAAEAGWRASFAVWAALGVVVLVPWVAIVIGAHRRMSTLHNQGAGAPNDTARSGNPPVTGPVITGKMRHSPVAWAVTLVFTLSSMNAYSMFSWLPSILTETAGVTTAEAGSLLGVFALMGLPASLLVPWLANRLGSVSPLIYLFIGCGILGYAGLLLFPETLTWLWVVLAGIGPALFPIALLLINRRTRSHHSAIALSGFVQSVGYTLGTVGPLGIGFLHDLTGGWTVPIGVLTVLYLGAIWSAFVLRVPRPVEDDWAAGGRR
ncbi:MFS transporter [Lysinibacter sp. HNR]|uniref:MFS transporter n=1 Tax=Lysinibacter sp. HNR TaxID=3031408 RepID=UPI0024353A2E|nr:MFS transporter [Lysinibacter sp. HNR]WGD36691.1 MFS transporter [Lysinibacter sp. HNR]